MIQTDKRGWIEQRRFFSGPAAHNSRLIAANNAFPPACAVVMLVVALGQEPCVKRFSQPVFNSPLCCLFSFSWKKKRKKKYILRCEPASIVRMAKNSRIPSYTAPEFGCTRSAMRWDTRDVQELWQRSTSVCVIFWGDAAPGNLQCDVAKRDWLYAHGSSPATVRESHAKICIGVGLLDSPVIPIFFSCTV